MLCSVPTWDACFLLQSNEEEQDCLWGSEEEGGRGNCSGRNGKIRGKNKKKSLLSIVYQGLTTDTSDGLALAGKFFAQSSFMCDCHPITGDCYTDCKDFEHLCTL